MTGVVDCSGRSLDGGRDGWMERGGAPQTGPVSRLWSHLTDGAAAVLH